MRFNQFWETGLAEKLVWAAANDVRAKYLIDCKPVDKYEISKANLALGQTESCLLFVTRSEVNGDGFRNEDQRNDNESDRWGTVGQ